MMNVNKGYPPANPQTKYAVLGCGFALLGFALFIAFVFALGLAG